MAANEPIDPRVRLAISRWPEDAPRGAVSTFCAEHRISRKSFYELRRRTRLDGAAAVLEPRSRRPASSPAKLTEEVKAQAVQVRWPWKPPGWITGRSALVNTDGDQLTITDLQGELLAEHTRPAPGVTYVGNGRRPGPRPKNP